MLATPTYGLRYPEDTDPPIGRDDQTQLEFLAEDVEKTLAALVADTGLRTDLDVVPGAGWTVTICEYRLIGKDMSLHLWLKRTGAAIDATSVGNIGDALLFTIADTAMRPCMDWFGQFRHSVTSGAFFLLEDGTCTLADMHSNSSIKTFSDESNSTVQFYANYPIP